MSKPDDRERRDAADDSHRLWRSFRAQERPSSGLSESTGPIRELGTTPLARQLGLAEE